VGERLNAGRLALLAATGIGEARVRRQPVIGLLATGNELIEPGQARMPGKIYESNRIMLSSLVTGAGGVPRTFPIVPDSLQETKQALERAFADSDGVITSGGVPW
jgi:molybdopterin molybdotransferase